MDTNSLTLEIKSEFFRTLPETETAECAPVTLPPASIVVVNDYSASVVSEIIRHLLGQRRPPSGSMTLLGEDVGSLSHRRILRLRRRLGISAGEISLIDDLTVEQNLLMPFLLRKHSARQARLRIEKICEALHLEELLKIPARRLGQVERRIVLLARALAPDPELALLEAPLFALTEQWRQAVIEQIKRLVITGSSMLIFHDQSNEFTSLRADESLRRALGYASSDKSVKSSERPSS